MNRFIYILILLLIGNEGFSNKITINNITGCEFYYSFRGLDDPLNPTSYFESEEILIPANQQVVFDSPSAIPGLSNLSSSATFYYIKGYCLELPSSNASNDVSIGDASWGFVSPFHTDTNNYYPVCNSNNSLTIVWMADSNNDIFVTIL